MQGVVELLREGLELAGPTVVTPGSLPIRLNNRVSIVPHARSVEIDGETVVYDPVREEVHLLDPVATAVWSLLHEPESLSDVCDQLAADFGASVEQVRTDVLVLVSKLSASGLVDVL